MFSIYSQRRHFKGCHNLTRHSSYTELHHRGSLTLWLNPPWASAVHAALCLTSEPLMHADAIHQLLPEPSEDFSPFITFVAMLAWVGLNACTPDKKKVRTTKLNPSCISEVTLFDLLWVHFISWFSEELSEQESLCPVLWLVTFLNHQ